MDIYETHFKLYEGARQVLLLALLDFDIARAETRKQGLQVPSQLLQGNFRRQAVSF